MAERNDLLDPILLRASALGCRLFRNNSGIAFHKDGSVVRYGVGGKGGADLLGWTPVMFHGKQVAVFTAIEGKWGKTALTPEQRQFLHVIHASGGIAIEAHDVEGVIERLQNERAP